MSGLLRTCGKMMRGCLNNSILSRDIINQAKKRTSKMLNHIYLETDVEDLIKSRSLSEKTKDVDHAAYSFQQRIKALALEMGENRALTTVDVIISRLEGAWRLQQKSHHDLANQYDTLVQKIRTLARDIEFDPAIASADDVMMIFTNLDQHWRQIQENLRKTTGALDFKNTQIEELATFLGVKTPVIESSVFDDIMVKWTKELSKFSDLEKALKEKEEESRLTSESLQNIAKLMGVSCPKNKDALLASITEIWIKSQSKISDLQEDLFQKREQIQRSTEDLQNLAKIFGLVHHPRGDTKKILDDITVKWEESKSLTSQLRTSLLLEKNKNNQAHETLQGLATFMGVETSGCETTMVGGMMDRWMENRREVIDLQRALMEEREKTKQAQEALQAHLSRPGPVLSSVSVQTDEDQVKSVGPGSLCDKSVQADRAFDIASGMSGGPGPLRKDDSILEATLVNAVTSPTSNCKTQQDVSEEVHPYIPEVTRARVSLETIASSAVSAGSSEKDPSRLELSPKGDVKRRSDPKFYQQAKQELQGIKEPLSLSISYRSHSFSSSSSRDLIHLGPRCRSLKTLSAGDAFRPPSRSSLLRGASAIDSAINSLQPPPDPSITVTQMTDLIPWAESRCTIKLGSGVAGTVYLFRHAVSKIPVAAKVVDCPGECFDNEVRIHQAISGLPWFPKLYGSFETEDDQAVLAMEFIGGESDDRSYTINDCLDKSFLKTGPDLTRDEWFDVMNDVAQGLKALHSKGFLSNDLKENNVLVVQESGVWRAKIIDLGWASEIATPFFLDLDEDQIEFYESGRGCLHVAPECVSNERPCSTSSDVYSLGRLLASVGRAMGYDDFYFNGMQIYLADEHQRPTVQEVIDKLYEIQLEGGGEEGPGSSSC